MSISRRVSSLAIALIVALVVCGCGKSESSNSAPAPTNPDQPMAGKAPTGASQFVGKWFAISEGAIESFEFMSDGNVVVTDVLARALGAGGMAKTLKYSVLEGGRLSLAAPNGDTVLYDTKLNGDQLEISGNMVVADEDRQHFQKLKPGETPEQKRKEMADARAKEYRERTAATEAFFKQKGLVLVFGSGSGINAAVVADNTFAGGFNGKAWHDAPSRIRTRFPGSLFPTSASRSSSSASTWGQRSLQTRVAPAPATRRSTSPAPRANMKVAGKVQFGNSGTPMDLTLKVDQAMHDQIVKRFDEQLAKLEAAEEAADRCVEGFRDHFRQGRQQQCGDA